MSDGYRAPVEEMLLVLRAIGGIETLPPSAERPEVDLETCRLLLEEAARFAAEVLAPLAPRMDREPPRLADGEVVTTPGVKEAYARFIEAGWNGLVFPERWGGQGLPRLLQAATDEMWNAANMTFALCPLLTQAGIEALLAHGGDELCRRYLPPLVSGRWTAAMCLTEPQAGSDLGALRCRAERSEDGYRLFGQKIFITFGDHDLADNIIHFVLARLPDAPAGTRGISLFLVPKWLPDEAGRPVRRNDMRCLKLEDKLGIHGSPTCVMAYGEEGGAVGYLIGEEHRGLRCMFTMMNQARIAVGNEGLGVAEAAFQKALAYARERVQGRRGGRPVPILAHPDVRRMLLTMRAVTAAMRCLCYETAAWLDRSERAPRPEERERARARVALLTPVCKAWCTNRAVEVVSLALQVHGGAGYIEETGIARLYRDVRITPIYEGTNGIQAIDLVQRKLFLEEGEAPWALLRELWEEGERLRTSPLAAASGALMQALSVLEQATKELQQADADDREAAAMPYLELFGWSVGAVLLARLARSAAETALGPRLIGAARFYLEQLLPQAAALAGAIRAGVAALDPDWLGEP